jgi:hypothetical protein
MPYWIFHFFFVTFRFGNISFRFVSIGFVSFDRFRFVLFDFVSFHFVSLRSDFISFRTLQVSQKYTWNKKKKPTKSPRMC